MYIYWLSVCFADASLGAPCVPAARAPAPRHPRAPAQLAGGGEQHSPRTRHRHAAEAVRRARRRRPATRPPALGAGGGPRCRRLDVVEERLGAGRRGRSRYGGTLLRRRQEGRSRPPSLRRRAGYGPRAGRPPLPLRSSEPSAAATASGNRLGADVLGEGSRARGRRAGRAQEVVHGRELGAYACRLATSRLHGLLGGPARVPCLARGAFGCVQLLAPELGRRNQLVATRFCGLLLGAKPSSSASTPAARSASSCASACSSSAIRSAGAPLASVAGSPPSERSASAIRSSSRPPRASSAAAVAGPAARSRRSSIRSAAERAPNRRLVSSSRARLCSAKACSAASRRAATAASSRSASSRAGARRARPPPRRRPAPPRAARSVVRGQLEPRLERLALEPLVQLGGLGLALQRPQPRARLALDVERARRGSPAVRSSLSCARRRRLRCLPSPAASSISSAAVARLRVDDRLDPALRDDRVHLLAEAGVGEHLEHVHEPAAGAVQPVLALAVAVEPADDRDLGEVAGSSRRRRCRSPPPPRRRCATAARGRRRRSRPASSGRAPRAGSARRAPRARRR